MRVLQAVNAYDVDVMIVPVEDANRFTVWSERRKLRSTRANERRRNRREQTVPNAPAVPVAPPPPVRSRATARNVMPHVVTLTDLPTPATPPAPPRRSLPHVTTLSDLSDAQQARQIRRGVAALDLSDPMEDMDVAVQQHCEFLQNVLFLYCDVL